MPTPLSVDQVFGNLPAPFTYRHFPIPTEITTTSHLRLVSDHRSRRNIPETQPEMRPNAQFRVKLSCVRPFIPALACARLYCVSGASLIYHRKRAMLLLLWLLRLLSFFFRISGEARKSYIEENTSRKLGQTLVVYKQACCARLFNFVFFGCLTFSMK